LIRVFDFFGRPYIVALLPVELGKKYINKKELGKLARNMKLKIFK